MLLKKNKEVIIKIVYKDGYGSTIEIPSTKENITLDSFLSIRQVSSPYLSAVRSKLNKCDKVKSVFRLYGAYTVGGYFLDESTIVFK